MTFHEEFQTISDVFCEVSNRFHFIVSFFLHFLVSPLFGELGRAPDKRVQFQFQFFFRGSFTSFQLP